MTTVLDHVPDHLNQQAQTAAAWFSAQQGELFEVTGIVDPPAPGESGELRLVLCGAGTCRQERFAVDGDAVTQVGAPEPDQTGVATLAPPPGANRDWLDNICSQHDFTLILFYRGFW